MRLSPRLAIFLLLALCACIDVSDFGAYWKKGTKDACLSTIIMRQITEGDKSKKKSEAEVRSLKVGDHTFAMVREHPKDKGGVLIRYDVYDGDYVSYKLDEHMRADFLKKYPHSPVVLTDNTATIAALNDKSVKFLSQIADDESYWLENSRLPYNPTHRSDCPQK